MRAYQIKKEYLRIFFIIIIIGFPLAISMWSIISGAIPFWFDPARDLLLAIDNLQKISLVGPPTGIPGILYGPYWIWLLSIALLISEDPRNVALLVLTLPYFIIFPLVLYKFHKNFGKATIVIVWLLFILNYQYSTYLWNPHLAPLLILITIYLLITAKIDNSNTLNLLKIFASGVSAGLVANFSTSIGVGIILGIILYFGASFIHSLLKKEHGILQLTRLYSKTFIFFGMGIFLVYIPFIIFEFRHNFHQTQSYVKAVFGSESVVGQLGLNKSLIVQGFLSPIIDLLGIPKNLSIYFYLLVLILFLVFIYRLLILKKFSLKREEQNLFILLTCFSFGILTIFLTTKNPVWAYHFIGVEIIFMLLIALISSRLIYLQRILIVWVIIIYLFSIRGFIAMIFENPLTTAGLASKVKVTKLISNDTKEQYTVFIHSRAIYTYDYSYLFNWIADKKVPFDPNDIADNSKLVYLIINETDTGKINDFISYRTPLNLYTTTTSWNMPDGTIIFKRIRKP